MTPEEKRIARNEHQKLWRQNHPGYYKEKQKKWRLNKKAKDPTYFTRLCKEWRKKNPERYVELTRKYNQSVMKKTALTSSQSKSNLRFKAMTSGGTKFKTALKDVAHHLARGRDVGTIAVWMNIPVSRVNLLIAKYQSEQTEQRKENV